MRRVVADTNILVSTLQFGGNPKQLLDLAADGHVDLVMSDAILEETLRVLRDKFARTPEWLAEADRQLRVVARLVEPTERFSPTRVRVSCRPSGAGHRMTPQSTNGPRLEATRGR